MTEPRCAQARELAPEVALGVAPVEERARVLEHVARCAGCRAHLAELSDVADDLLTLAPAAEPPSGFESAVLARMDALETAVPQRESAPEPRSMPGPGSVPEVGAVPEAAPRLAAFWRRDRFRRALRLAAVAVLVAALSGGAVWQAGQSDRELADQMRQTLDTADGTYFTAYPLRDPGGEQRGSVFAYQGEPTWLVCALEQPLPDGWYQVQLLTRDGDRHQLAKGRYLAGLRAWGYEMPGSIHDATRLRILDQQGRVVLSAALAR